MILTVAILIGLVATLLRARLYRRSLKLVQLRWEWLVFIAVIPQLLVFQIRAVSRLIPESVVPTILILSMVGLLAFAVANMYAPGLWAMVFGLVSNLVVICLNKGWMPISPETILRVRPDLTMAAITIGARVGISKDRILAATETNMGWLSDCLILPGWFPYKFAFSIGDVFISIGVLLLLWSLSSTSVNKEVYDTNS